MPTRSEINTGNQVLSPIPFDAQDGIPVKDDAKDSNDIKGDILGDSSRATLAHTCGETDPEASHKIETPRIPRANSQASGRNLEGGGASKKEYPFVNQNMLQVQPRQKRKRKLEIIDSENEDSRDLKPARKRHHRDPHHLDSLYEEILSWKVAVAVDVDCTTQSPSSYASSIWSDTEPDEEEPTELEKALDQILSVKATDSQWANSFLEAFPSASEKTTIKSGHPHEEDRKDVDDESAVDHDTFGITTAVPMALSTNKIPIETEEDDGDDEEGSAVDSGGIDSSYNGELEGFEDRTDFFSHLSGLVGEGFVRSNVVEGTVDGDESENAQDFASDADDSGNEEGTNTVSDYDGVGKEPATRFASNTETTILHEDPNDVDNATVELQSSDDVDINHPQEESEANRDEEDKEHLDQDGEAVDKAIILACIKASNKKGVLKALPKSQVSLKITGVDKVAAALVEFKAIGATWDKLKDDAVPEKATLCRLRLMKVGSSLVDTEPCHRVFLVGVGKKDGSPCPRHMREHHFGMLERKKNRA